MALDLSQSRYKNCITCLFLILVSITIIGVLISGRTKEAFETLEKFQNSPTPFIQTQTNPSGNTTCYTGFRT